MDFMDYQTLLSHKERMIKYPTISELNFQKVCDKLKSQINYKIEKQFIFWINNRTGYIVDFYIPQLKLVFEVDGSIHNKQKEYDEARTAYLKKRGLTIKRIDNSATRYKSITCSWILKCIAKQERLLLLKQRARLKKSDDMHWAALIPGAA